MTCLRENNDIYKLITAYIKTGAWPLPFIKKTYIKSSQLITYKFNKYLPKIITYNK